MTVSPTCAFIKASPIGLLDETSKTSPAMDDPASADQTHQLLGVIAQVQQLDGVTEEDQVFREIVCRHDGNLLDLRFQHSKLLLDVAILFLGEVILRVFG